MRFEKELPGDIRFGNGVRHLLPGLLPPGKTLVIGGRHAHPEIRMELRAELSDHRATLAPPVSPELPLDEVAATVKLARELRAVNFVGWGGGSAMDCAKAVAALAGCDADVAECFYGRAQAPARNNFLVLLPTSAGTGAEVTANAVITDRATGVKQSLRAPGMTANCALVDPELLRNAPAAVIAGSGFDALTQALESFLSRKADALTRQMAAAAAKFLLNALPGACRQEADKLTATARGSLLAGMAFASSGLGAVHGIGHPAGSSLGVPHGVCCAILLPTVLRRNLPACQERFDELAGALDLPDAEALIAEVVKLRRELGLPENFRKYGNVTDHMEFIVRNCRSGSMKCNPRELADDEVAAILEELR